MTKSSIFSKWNKPGKFDYNLLVVGAGSAGLVSSYIAAALKAKVALIEQHKMGGDCLNTGCVPSKALIRSTRFLAQLTRSPEFGIKSAKAEFEFAEIMERVQNIIKIVAPHDSIERYSQLGVDVVTGFARLISPWEVEVTTESETRIITTRAIIVATGAHPLIPEISGIEKINFLSSDTIWNLRELPKRLLVLGGGPIGCELSQCFARLGTKVTQVEMADRLLIREDPEVSEIVAAKFAKEGIDVRLEHTAKQFILEKDETILLAEHQGQEVRIAFDQVLLALGRVANITGFGLEDIGVAVSSKNAIEVDGFQATNYPNIFVCGDVSGSYQFTHTAAHQAWYATVNALFGGFKKFRTDYSVIPWCTFTEPEVAHLGLNELEAQKKGIAYELSSFDFSELDRAIADSETNGFIKVLTVPGKSKILGVTIVGVHAGDLIAEFVLAMKHNIGLDKILATIHIYPTLAEANKNVAGVWRRKHQPRLLLTWVAWFHKLRRG